MYISGSDSIVIAEPIKKYQKKKVGLSVRSDLVSEAKTLGINMSNELELALIEKVLKLKAANWKQENQQAILAQNKFLEENGLPFDGMTDVGEF
jgi:antitoxin CcdA